MRTQYIGIMHIYVWDAKSLEKSPTTQSAYRIRFIIFASFFLLLRTEFDSQMEETKSVFVMKNSYFSKRLIRYDHENARFMGCSFDARLSMEQ